MSKRTTDSLVFGLVLLALGTVFLLWNFGVDISIWPFIAKYWPVILIVFGVLKVKRALEQRMGSNESA